jgi:hypothetical protein
MTLLDPWILARLVAGLAAATLLLHAAWVGGRVLKFHHLGAANEGQLALERQVELAGASARVGAGLAVLALVLSAVAADRLSSTIRGAMCGFGVVHATTWGPWSIALSIVTALAAGSYLGILRLDRDTRDLSLIRAVAMLSLPVAALALADLVAATAWLGGLDRDVVASCCSVGADTATNAASRIGHEAGPRVLATWGAALLGGLAVVLAARSSRAPTRPSAIGAGVIGLAALPVFVLAVVLEVAPHVYEVPHHRCPYCLLRADAWGIGYPLFGAALLAASWAGGTLLGALVARGPAATAAFPGFARALLRREAVAWAIALVVSAVPVVRYAIVAGAPLFR